MDTRNKLLLIIGGGVILVVAIILVLFFLQDDQPAIIQPDISQPDVISVPVVTTVPTPVTKEEAQLNNDVTRTAIIFAERFGSFSNQSDFDNIEDLKQLMTARMSEWAEGYVAEQKSSQKDNSVYYGISTKMLSSNIDQLDEQAGTAQLTLTTQRTESTETTANSKVFIQDITITLVKVSGNWKVDSAFWK